METKRTYYRPTTVGQRRLLFETWEATGNVEEACAKAKVSRRTFYNWKARIKAGGHAALAEERSHAPKQPRRTADEVEARVRALRSEHPAWGKRRIAEEVAKANNWQPLVTPNTVRRILQDAGLWPKAEAKKGGRQAGGRQAEAGERAVPRGLGKR